MMSQKLIAIVGSVGSTLADYQLALRNVEQAEQAAHALGRELAQEKYRILVFSSHASFEAMSPTYLYNLTGAQFGEAVAPQRFHMHKYVGRTLAACQEAKSTNAIEPLDHCAFPVAFRLDDDMGALWQL